MKKKFPHIDRDEHEVIQLLDMLALMLADDFTPKRAILTALIKWRLQWYNKDSDV